MTIPEFTTLRAERGSFIDKCASLKNKELTNDALQEHSSLLNRYYPKSASYGSPSLNQWKAARDNINILFSLNGIQPPKHPTHSQQVITGVTIGVITFVITSVLTFSGAMFLSSGYIQLGQDTKKEPSSQAPQVNKK